MSLSEIGDLFSHLSPPPIPPSKMETFEPRKTIMYGEEIKHNTERYVEALEAFLKAVKLKSDGNPPGSVYRPLCLYWVGGVGIILGGKWGLVAVHLWVIWLVGQKMLRKWSSGQQKKQQQQQQHRHVAQVDETDAQKNELNGLVNFVGKLVGNSGLSSLQNTLHDVNMSLSLLNEALDGGNSAKSVGLIAGLILSIVAHLQFPLRFVYAAFFTAVLFVLSPKFVR